MSKKAHNKCNKCKHEWDDFPGAHAQIRPVLTESVFGVFYDVGCPKCGNAYWDWTNYEEICNDSSD